MWGKFIVSTFTLKIWRPSQNTYILNTAETFGVSYKWTQSHGLERCVVCENMLARVSCSMNRNTVDTPSACFEQNMHHRATGSWSKKFVWVKSTLKPSKSVCTFWAMRASDGKWPLHEKKNTKTWEIPDLLHAPYYLLLMGPWWCQ